MVIALVIAAPLFAGLPDLPPIRRSPSVTFLDRTGAVLAVRDNHAPAPVNLERLPKYVPAAFVAIEDRRFYEHGGFDPAGIARAIVTDLARGHTAQGASTITQQLARNLFLSQDQTMERKATELVYAVQLEQKYSKAQILSLYLSRVYFGSGAWGLEAASQRFFDKPASKLTLREAAALAAVLKSPAGYSPVEAPERNADRSRLVLDAMVETGAITPAQRAHALAKPLRVRQGDPALPNQWFVDWVDRQARTLVPSFSQDLVVETTLDERMEASASTAAKSAAASGAERQAAIVALDPFGRVRAMIGGSDYASAPYNRAVEAHRQAGSSWKPFVYLTALEAGRTPATVVVDEPVTIAGWSPRNYEPEFLGAITLQQALAGSINTVAARLADEVGRPRVAATARRLGIGSPINTDPAMALGTAGVTPLEMATAYTALGNGGQRVQPYAIERIRTTGGQVLWRRPPPTRTQAIANPPLTDLVGMMRTVLTQGTGRRAAIAGYDLAGKTGTTSDNKDAWFCGFTGGLTTVVWVGRDDARPMPGVTGGGVPAATWRSFMVAALPRADATPIPAGPPGPAPTAPPAAAPVATQTTMAPIPDPVDALLPNATGAAAPRPPG